MKYFQGINLKKLGNAATFLSFLAFSFLTFSILNPVGRSDADETQTVDYTIGAYNLSMAANTEVDAHAIAGYDQKVFSTLDYISLSNTCPDGLSVMISSNSETNALVGDNGSEIIATEPGGELSDNSWGFSLDNGSIWNAVPKNDENPIVVYKTTTELADPTNFSILYGFKIDRNAVRDGIYSTDVLYTMAPDAGCFIYKVIWDGAGGEVSEDLPTFIDQDELVNLSALPKPIRDYYDFAGWEIDGVTYTGEETAVDINIHNNPIINATALWTPTIYSISYNLNGGSVSDNPTNYNVESESLSLNNPTRHGYTFKGWSGPDLIGDENKAVVIPTGSHDNRVYIANWTPIDYALTYELNGGSATNPTTYNVETGAITLNNPTRADYDFVGWSGTGLSGTNNKSVTIPAASYGNRSYTANWTPKNYSISYTMNGGSATNPTSYNVETNSFTLNNPTRANYDFVGWSGTGLTGSNNKTVTITKGSSGNRSYTANFSPTSYSISYTLNGGSATNPTSYTVESNNFTLNNPSRSYYDFSGWGGTGLTGTGNKTVTIAQGSTGARSYTAYWTPTNYSISYTLNGGSVSGNPTSYNIESNAFTLNNPTRANYNFTGWSGTGLSGTGNKSVTVPKGSAGNRSYTANWAPICSFTSKDFGYTGGVQSWTVPTGCGGTYKLEVWGGQGGAYGNDQSLGGGAGGGYAAGNVSLQAGNVLYVVVGGAGMKGGCGWSTGKDDYTAYGGYNGGGTGRWLGTGDNANYTVVAGGGGGATHIGKTNALLKNTAIGNLYIVAGGGGGTGDSCAAGRGTSSGGGSGGGTNGGSTSSNNYGGNDTHTTNAGATQSSGYAYGQGGDYGGGGGLYGGYGAIGGASWSSSDGGNGWVAGATGGSGYVGGVTGGTMSNGVRAGHGYARITKV